MATRYNSKWRASCPRCSQSLSQADYRCQNCSKGPVMVSEHRVSGVRSIYFGCNICGHAADLGCTKCGAKLHEPVVKTSGPLAAVLTVVIMLALLFVLLAKG